MQKRNRHLYLWSIVAALIVVVLCASIPAVRIFFLSIPARALVIPEPVVKPVDVIVVTVDAYRIGVLDAADLVHEGVTSRVAVFGEPADAADRELARRGVRDPDQESVAIGRLDDLGIHDAERIPIPVNGSESEGVVLPQWCERNHIRSLLVVVNENHARRVSRILRRGFKGHTTSVIVYPSRYSDLDPDTWWKTRTNAREVIIEFQKLMLDVARHPL